jgi:DNA-directed RNA polymerase subunit K/omega
MNKTQDDDIPKKVVEVNEVNDEDDEDIIESENEGDDDDVNENVDNNDSDIEDPDDINDDDDDEDNEDEEGEGDDDDNDIEGDEDNEGDEDEDEDDEGEGEGEDEEGIAMKKTKKTKKSSNKKNINISGIEMLQTTKKNFPRMVNDDEDDDEDDDDDLNEEYLQKFDNELRENYILDNHPELNSHNYEEIKALSRVTRDGRGIIIDSLHKTIPILTKYEMTRILGQRAKQLDSGAKSFVKVPVNVIDGYFIAMLELEQKKIPFIIKRPLPNGGVEYWNISDLEIIL